MRTCRRRKAAQSFLNEIIAPCQGSETRCTSESCSQLFHVTGSLVFQGLCMVTVHGEIIGSGSICSEHGSHRRWECHRQERRHMAKDRAEAEKRTHVLGSARSDFPEDRYCSMIKITVSWRILKLRQKIIGKMEKKKKKRGENFLE